MASSIGIFDDWQVTTELSSTWSARKDQLEKERFQPYADLLLDNIVWPQILQKKDAILAELKQKCSTSFHPSELCVPIWSFNDTNDFTHTSNSFDRAGQRKMLERAEQIHENGWRQTLEMLNVESSVLLRQPIARIIKKTDFLEQLATLFGGSFRVVSRPSDFIQETDPSGEEYYRFTVTLYLQYFPNGLLKHFKKIRAKHLEEFAGRDRQTLGGWDKLIFSAKEGEETVVYGPPVSVAPIRNFGYSCACCSHDDDYENEYDAE